MNDPKQLAKFDIAYPITMAIDEMKAEFLPLTIDGISDIEGYERVDAARKFVKAEKVAVEKRRVEYKADILEAGRLIDSRAKEILTPLIEIETALKAKQDEIDGEKARIRFEAEQKAKIPARVAQLVEIGHTVSNEDYPLFEAELLKMNDIAFGELVNKLTAEKLERQRAEQERIEAEQRAERGRIDAELRKIEEDRLAAEREKKHQQDIEDAKRKAAEDARIQAEIDAKRKEDERIAAEAAQRAEQERIEAEKPDKDKLLGLASIFEEMIYPEMASKRGAAKVMSVRRQVADIVDELRSFK